VTNTKPGKAPADRVIDTIGAEDSGRLVTYACNRIAKDIANEKTDIIAFNTYPGTIVGWFADPPRHSGAGLDSKLVSPVRHAWRRCVFAFFC